MFLNLKTKILIALTVFAIIAAASAAKLSNDCGKAVNHECVSVSCTSCNK